MSMHAAQQYLNKVLFNKIADIAGHTREGITGIHAMFRRPGLTCVQDCQSLAGISADCCVSVATEQIAPPATDIICPSLSARHHVLHTQAPHSICMGKVDAELGVVIGCVADEHHRKC